MNIPILIIGFNRPELIVKRLHEVYNSTITPKKIFVSIDGGGGISKSEIIMLSSRYFDKLNVDFIVRQKNLGCSNHIMLAISEILSAHSMIIVIEDDVSISPHFIKTLSKELLKLDNASNLAVIGGFSPFLEPKKFTKLVKNYWRESSYFSAWGWGTTKFFWDSLTEYKDIIDANNNLSSSKSWNRLSSRKKRIWLKRFSRKIWDYKIQYNFFLQDKRSLLPIYRLIFNEGFSDTRSTHTKHKKPWNFFGNGYSVQVPKYRIKSCYKIFWKFIDANFWAADGYFNARGREKGLRTTIRFVTTYLINLRFK